MANITSYAHIIRYRCFVVNYVYDEPVEYVEREIQKSPPCIIAPAIF
jgi:hypothetical protein